MTDVLTALLPTSVLRPVPYDEAAEAACLGALIYDRDAILKLASWLAPGDFYRDAHGAIYGAILDLFRRREPPDLQTIASELDRRGALPGVGGLAYLARLMNACPTAVHVEYYGRIVAHQAILRRLITVGGQIAGLGYEEEPDLAAVLDQAESLLLAVTQRQRASQDQTDHHALTRYIDGLEARQAGEAGPPGWRTGLTQLDDLTKGARPGRLWVVTGESGGGKSTLQQVLATGTRAAGAAVGYYSLEMGADELAEKELAARAGVDSALMAEGALTGAELDRVYAAYAALLAAPPMRLITGGGVTLRDITAQAHRWAAEGGLDVLVIDYLQLVRLPGRGNPVGELDDLVNGLKALAMDLRIAVITGAQLSRGAISKEAAQWDNYLRGSGAIKQAADVVLAVAPQGDRPADATRPWPITLSLTKHRGGPTGEVAALWWLAYSRVAEVGDVARF